jgi:hypothetical protein
MHGGVVFRDLHFVGEAGPGGVAGEGEDGVTGKGELGRVVDL